jgi:hypothetical protein
MTRCPKGTRKNKKTGICESHEKTKRSPKGTGSLRLYQPRTPDYPPPPPPNKAALYLIHPNDMRSPDHSPPPHISSTQKRKKRKAASNTRKTQKPVENNNWKIYRISYLYPTITDSVPPPIDQLGFINIQSIILRNGNDNSLAEIEFHGPDKNATTKDLKKILSNDDNTNDISNDISEIKFYGTENDEYGDNTTKENIAEVKKKHNGNPFKIKVSGKGPFYTLDCLNDNDKKQILEETIKLLKKTNYKLKQKERDDLI